MQCRSNKEFFKTKVIAERWAKLVRKRNEKRKVRVYLRTYKCKMCKLWHLTSQRPKPKILKKPKKEKDDASE